MQRWLRSPFCAAAEQELAIDNLGCGVVYLLRGSTMIIRSIAVVILLAGCSSMSEMHDADDFALRDSFAAVRAEKGCERPLEVISSASLIRRPYRQLASLSTSCSPGVPHLCERRLKERACALGADALVYQRNRGGVSYTGAVYNEVSLDGRALRWVD